ncbi:MAG: hypothetical protein LUI12_04790 [Clostridiales bacterium]|nr:hypothetical protein [Clostridiales bacterium]
MKNIAVYGTGVNCLAFLMENEKENIKYFIEEKKDIREFAGRPVLRLEDALREKLFIVVASSASAYYEIKENLEKWGLCEFEDFTYYEIYQRKIALIYGNCHITPIKEGLCLSKEFRKEYGFYPLKQIQCMTERDLDLPVYGICDLFLHQSIRSNNRYGERYSSQHIEKKLKPACRIISFPNLYGLPKCFFPQVYDVGRGKGNEGYNVNYFPYRDKYIDESYMNGLSLAQIVSNIVDTDYISKADIQTAWEVFMEKLYSRQKDWDINITDFILGCYRSKQLFHDPYHPSNIIMEYIAAEISKKLGIGVMPQEYYFGLTRWDALEIPIYKSVTNALGLEYFPGILRKYNRGYRLRNIAMDLGEYVEEYIMWNFGV